MPFDHGWQRSHTNTHTHSNWPSHRNGALCTRIFAVSRCHIPHQLFIYYRRNDYRMRCRRRRCCWPCLNHVTSKFIRNYFLLKFAFLMNSIRFDVDVENGELTHKPVTFVHVRCVQSTLWSCDVCALTSARARRRSYTVQSTRSQLTDGDNDDDKFTHRVPSSWATHRSAGAPLEMRFFDDCVKIFTILLLHRHRRRRRPRLRFRRRRRTNWLGWRGACAYVPFIFNQTFA